ncbi:MAG: hypothetical protein ACK53V_09535, partial [Planctomycetota bacterium]
DLSKITVVFSQFKLSVSLLPIITQGRSGNAESGMRLIVELAAHEKRLDAFSAIQPFHFLQLVPISRSLFPGFTPT